MLAGSGVQFPVLDALQLVGYDIQLLNTVEHNQKGQSGLSRFARRSDALLFKVHCKSHHDSSVNKPDNIVFTPTVFKSTSQNTSHTILITKGTPGSKRWVGPYTNCDRRQQADCPDSSFTRQTCTLRFLGKWEWQGARPREDTCGLPNHYRNTGTADGALII